MKIRKILLYILLIGFSGLQAQSTSKLDQLSNTNYQPSETRKIDITHTRLEIRPFFNKRSLYGKAFLNIQAYNRPITEIELDAQAMKIRQVFIIHESGFIEVDYEYDGLKLKVILNKKYDLEEQFTLFIEYTSHPYTVEEKGIDKAYGRGVYFVDPFDANPMKPTQLWTIGETKANSIWFPTVDAPNESFTQEIFITVDPKLTTLSNGILKGTEINADGTKTDHWRQNKPHAPYLAMMAIGDFQVSLDDWGPIKVTYYTTPEYSKDVRHIFGQTPYMMSYFSNLLGVDFPWEKYAQVVVYDFTSGAMENTSASTFYQPYYADRYDALDKNFDDIIAHEIMHQWFGDLVTCESWAHLALNEAFATYGEYLWFHNKYGADEGDKLQYDYLNIYLAEALYKSDPIINHYFKDPDEDLFDAHRYEKGSMVVHMLRNVIGDDYFFKGLEYYLKTHRHRPVEVHDLRMAFEKVTGSDLNWFFEQWFMVEGHPVVDLKYDYNASNGEITVAIDQVQTFKNSPAYIFPLDIDVYVDGKVKRQEVWVENKKESFSFKVSSQPDLVNVDASKVMLWEKNDYKTEEQWAFQYKHAPHYVDRIEALEALYTDQSSTYAKSTFKSALNDKFWGIRNYAVKYIALEENGINEIALNRITKLAISDENSKVRQSALKTLAAFDNTLALPVCDSLLNNDSSRLVLGTALSLLYDSDNATYFKKASQFEHIKNYRTMAVIAKIYGEQADKSKHEFFKKCIWTTRGRHANTYASHYVEYLKRMDVATIKDASLVLMNMAQFEEDESIINACKNALYDLKAFFDNNSTVAEAGSKAAIVGEALGKL